MTGLITFLLWRDWLGGGAPNKNNPKKKKKILKPKRSEGTEEWRNEGMKE